ncbi:hypothetical protein SAMN00017405_0523 [Desulfonispora thiosulfatigenes DSM 11270]|uniref:Uncharacterized protein n=1 Tax=Desulfonispora thiosulfatigenes DSM 11270 TaxID=656914 RepID=A0A1W1V5W9_DESTI|nr:hypothetical protein SAMN00017405_0523 [Desulfonispora thiosulfatigenes DSM 11270]
MIKLKEFIENEYGSKKMKLQNLWICFFLVPLIPYINWVINKNTYGFILDFASKCVIYFIISTIILILSATLFSNGNDNKFVKFLLTIIVCISWVTTFSFLIPIGLLLKFNQFLEILSRFKLDEIKLVVYMVSSTISLLIITIYLGVAIPLYSIIDLYFSVSYIFLLLLMVLFILSFNTMSKWMYKFYIITTKSYHSKRQFLQAYFQNYKEKNIVLFLIFLLATLYIYSQKNQDDIMQASTASIATIILLDALIDKWKNKFHKTDMEYRFVEFLSMDIQIINSQVESSNFTNINLKLKPNDHIELMRHLSITTTNRSFKKIIGIYETLISEYQPYDRFTENIFDLESKIIAYIIRCN